MYLHIYIYIYIYKNENSEIDIYDSGMVFVEFHNEVPSRKAEFSSRLRSVSAREIGGMLPKTEHLGEFEVM